MTKHYSIVVGLILLLSGCVNNLQSTDETEEGLPRDLTESEAELIQATQDFSYELFRQVIGEGTRENVLISPMAVSLALATPMNGAFGETREEIAGTLHLDHVTLQEVNSSYKGVMDLLLNLDPDAGLSMANGLWHREDMEVKEVFTRTAEELLLAEVRAIDPEDENADDIINEWVQAKTGGHIDYIIDSVSPYMTMHLLNAVYFQGSWRYEFDPGRTQRSEFYPAHGSPTEVDMMEQELDLAAYITDDVEVAEVPYGNGSFTMMLIIPDTTGGTLDRFIAESLTRGNIDRWSEEWTVDETLLRLPRFRLEYEHNLKGILGQMGMAGAFERSADFYNISSDEEVYLNEVKHKTLLHVDEKGTDEAPTASPDTTRSITVDRPFILLIRERHTGAILFMGKVENPSL